MTKRDKIQKEIVQKILDKDLFTIAHVAPRVGKIKITLDCLKDSDKVIVAYPQVNIKKSWVDDVKRWKFKNPKNISYTTYMSFKKLRNPCDVLVLDEIHLTSDAQLDAIAKYINILGIKKVIGLSGTLSVETQLKIKLKLGLDVGVIYSIDQAVADGVITDYKIEVYKTPLSTVKDIKVVWSGGEFMTSEKQSFDRLTNKLFDLNTPIKTKMLRLQRMGLIKKSKAKIDLTKKILEDLSDKRVLVFTGLTEVADGLGIDSYHSKNDDESVKDKFLAGDISKLAIVNKLNTGITFAKLNTAVINFFDSNSENMAQKISRVTCMEYDNPDKIAHIIIITSDEEVELKWLNKSLSFFDPSKITYK